MRMRGTSDSPISRCTSEQATSQERQPMQSAGSGMITPPASAIAGNASPFVMPGMPTPTSATAEAAAPARFMKSRRLSAGAPASSVRCSVILALSRARHQG